MNEQRAKEVNNKKVELNITTPRGFKFREAADMVIMRCIDGNMGVLSGHEPVSAVLGDGILQIFNGGVEKKLAVFGGVVEIKDSKINLFSTIAQHPDEIDLERAERDRREMEAALEDRSEELQLQSSHILLRRSLVRIEVSQHLADADTYKDDENGKI